MARYFFHLPDIGEGVAEAEVVAWHVKPGDVVSEDQSLVDVMTDKATVDMTSPVEGTVIAIHGDLGASVAVGSVLVELEIVRVAIAAEEPVETVADGIIPPPQLEKPASSPSRPAPAHHFPPLASPSTRRRARERGIPLDQVVGSGPKGRIIVEDLDTFVASAMATPTSDVDEVVETRIIGMRRKIAEKMQEAKRRVPHITYVEECDLTELEALRVDMNAHRSEGEAKLTLLPFFIRALVKAVANTPQINARYDDDAGILRTYRQVHVGIAAQTDAGLMVPVLRNAGTLNLQACAREIARLSQAARQGTVGREELTGSTITITSLGTLGGVTTTPVINHPEVAILGPNKIVERPVVSGNFVAVRKIMNLSSSFDHRIVDGYDAARFIQRMKRLIEHPALMFID